MTEIRSAVEKKIQTPHNLCKTVTELKAKGLRIVHCHGVFDLVHPGHIKHLEAAKREGDILLVSVTPDRYVNKGPGRPVFNESLRAETLAALECVDYVAINEWPTAVETICLLMPDVYVKGCEYADRESDITKKIYDEETAIVSVGGRIHFTDEITFSSSTLINNHLSVYPPQTEDWLKEFRERHSAEEVIGYLERARNLKALVVGEAIIDEYVFCDGLGKSSKDPILAFKYSHMETHVGGSLAVANHLAGFCDHVGLITLLGETRSREEFLRDALHPNVTPTYVTWQGAPTIHKRRFVDTHTNAKMFELYVMDDSSLQPQTETELTAALTNSAQDYDLVVVPDYGHGMLTPAIIDILCDSTRFLVVNTQANAGNRGFNTISKYRRADYICIAAHELALETRARHENWPDQVKQLVTKIQCPCVTVTRGKDGSLHYSPDLGFVEAPALAPRVIDRVGAGDSVLAVTALLVVQKAPWDLVGFVGNVAGAEMVDLLGNRLSLNSTTISKHIVSLMK